MIEALIRAVEAGDELGISLIRAQLLNDGWTDEELYAELGVEEPENE